jgi:precorrin-6B methylase 2
MTNDGIVPDNICPEEVDCVGVEQSKEMPGMFEMAKNLLKDGSAIVGNALAGNTTLVSDEMRKKRWNTCLTCPSLQNDRCTQCGCFMKVKVAFQTSKCPVEKW